MDNTQLFIAINSFFIIASLLAVAIALVYFADRREHSKNKKD